MRRCSLFTEIGLIVIDQLGSEEKWEIRFGDAHHLRALASCARTCKDWLHRSRVNLYRTIYITDRDSIKSLCYAFAVIPSLPALVETVKSTSWDVHESSHGGLPVKLYEVVQFIRETQLHLFKEFTFHGKEEEDWSISVSNPLVHTALFKPPYASLHTLSVSDVAVSRVLFLLRAFTSLHSLRCRQMLKDDGKVIYPRHLSLASFEVLEVSTAAFKCVCVLTQLGVAGRG